MSLQKLENYSNKAVVQEEVLILTELLEDITKNMLARQLYYYSFLIFEET